MCCVRARARKRSCARTHCEGRWARIVARQSLRASAWVHLEFGNEQRELELREQELVHQGERQRRKQIEHH